jgi:outer membrane protein assembly factor BamB
MVFIRGLKTRLTAGRSRLLFIGVVILLMITMSGCRGGLRHESWPGMTLVDDILYVANLERVQAINTESGKVYWSFPPESDNDVRPFYSTPVLAGDMGEYGYLLIAGFKDRTVYALKLGQSPTERPDEAWRFADAGGQYVGSGAIYQDLFIIGNGDGKAYALNIMDGSLVWSFQTSDRIWATPVIVDDIVYVASLDNTLYALNVETGTEVWRLDLEGAIATTPVYASESLWLGDFTSKFYRVNPTAGSIEWTYEAEDWIWATPVHAGDLLYVVDVGGNLFSVNTETNTIVWSKSDVIADIVHGRPVLDAEAGRLYIAGYEKGEIHVVSTENGSLVNTWTQKDAGRLPGDLLSDGERLFTLPIMVSDRIQAFDLYTGDRIWPEVED